MRDALVAAAAVLVPAAVGYLAMWFRVRRAELQARRERLPPSSAPPPWWRELRHSLRPLRPSELRHSLRPSARNAARRSATQRDAAPVVLIPDPETERAELEAEIRAQLEASDVDDEALTPVRRRR